MQIGIIHRMWYMLIFAGAVSLVCMTHLSQAAIYVEGGFGTQPSFGNYLIKWLRGMTELKQEQNSREVFIPCEWIVLQLSYMTIIAGYAGTNLRQCGYQIFLRSGSKLNWWRSKYIWLLGTTILYYLVFIGIVWSFAMASGNGTIQITSNLWVGQARLYHNWAVILITSVLANYAIGSIQLVLEIIATPIIAIVVTMGYCVAGVFWCQMAFVGNYGMLYRTDSLNGSNGLNSLLGMAISLLIILCTYIAGRIYIRKFEI